MNKTKLEIVQVRQLVVEVLRTHPDELDCEQCLDQVDRFVEMTLAGCNAAEAMPLLQYHLEQCHCCREEFEALLTVLRFLQQS